MSIEYMDYMRQLFDQATSSTSTLSATSLINSHDYPSYNSDKYKKLLAAAEQAVAQLEAGNQTLQKTAMAMFDGGLVRQQLLPAQAVLPPFIRPPAVSQRNLICRHGSSNLLCWQH